MRGGADQARDVLIGGAANSTTVFTTGGNSLQDPANGSQTDLLWNFRVGFDSLAVPANDHSNGLGATFTFDITNGGGISGTLLYNGTPDHPVAYLVGQNVTVDQIAAGGHLLFT